MLVCTTGRRRGGVLDSWSNDWSPEWIRTYFTMRGMRGSSDASPYNSAIRVLQEASCPYYFLKQSVVKTQASK